MSGYSPTWTTKGSDKLRILQVTKILMNSIEQIILSVDLSNQKIKDVLINAVADSVFRIFTPHKDLAVENQFQILLEFLGWKIISVDSEEEDIIVLKLGANRFIEEEIDNMAYNIIVQGLAKSLGYFVFDKNVKTELVSSQFDITEIQVIIRKTQDKIPLITKEELKITEASDQRVEASSIEKKSKEKKPQLSAESIEIQTSIEFDVSKIFEPLLENYPTTSFLPILHKVLAEIITSFLADLEDQKVKKAKKEYSEKHILFLMEFLLINAVETEQKISELADLVGQYVIKAHSSKTNENLKEYLPDELTSEISRRVAYLEFPARAFCTYAPGEKCVEGKRDLCDFVLFMWQGMLKEIVSEKKFRLGERIAATRRGKYCLAEFLKEE